MQLTAFEREQQFIFMCFVVQQIACLFVCFFHTDSQINGKVPLFTRLGFIHQNNHSLPDSGHKEAWRGLFCARESSVLCSSGKSQANLCQQEFSV